MTGSKRCSACKQYKPLDQFGRNRSNPDNLQRWCKDCNSEYHKQHRKNSPSVVARQKQFLADKKEHIKNSQYLAEYYEIQRRRTALKQHYNISLEDYDKLYNEQNGVCAICEQPETARYKDTTVKYLAVDHNHTTGKVRGLLCRLCNTKLAILENTVFVERANMYLIKYKTD